jgi:uncharacterized protein (DUF2062 family)
MSEDSPQNEQQGYHRRGMEAFRKAYHRFLKIRGNPKEIALGFALGLFVGMSPFMGLHTAIAVPLAALFKWNKFSAAFAVWISNPFSAPIIYGVTYFIGAKVLLVQDSRLPGVLNLEGLFDTLRSAPEIVGILVVGGVVAGLPLAVIGYYFALKAITEYRQSIRQKIEAKKANIAKKLHRKKAQKKKKNKKKTRR